MVWNVTAIGGVPSDDRYGVKGESDWLYIPAVAAPPTLDETEVEAGDLLTEAIQNIEGFNVTDTFTPAQDLSGGVSGNIWDGATVDGSALTFYKVRGGSDASSLFTAGQLGYILHLPEGLADNAEGKLWPISRVGSVRPVAAISGYSLVRVSFGLNAPFDVTLPVST